METTWGSIWDCFGDPRGRAAPKTNQKPWFLRAAGRRFRHQNGVDLGITPEFHFEAISEARSAGRNEISGSILGAMRGGPEKGGPTTSFACILDPRFQAPGSKLQAPCSRLRLEVCSRLQAWVKPHTPWYPAKAVWADIYMWAFVKTGRREK